MAEITAAAVKSLRERTGAGMMDCKKALQEASGDEEAAIDLLRQRGAAKAAKRAARTASEGMVHIAERDGKAAMVEVLTETDFVARSDDFEAFVGSIAEALFDLPLPDGEVLIGERLFEIEGGEALEAALNELRVKVGENVQVGRVVRYDIGGEAVVGSYLHFGNRIGVMVEVSGAGDAGGETARGIAMHAAATNPAGLSPDDIPADVIERERSVLIEQAKESGKPPEIAEKMVEGRMRRFFEENALLWQAFVRDPDKKIKDLVSEAGDDVSVRRFARFEVGA
ncbi:MAG: translation elongation factor Ts [Gemmatimonadota bacterium]|nr:translation elongation factor Ts [Gemmatimonadota bacterium]